MDEFAEKLNHLLVDTFRHILKVEEELIQSSGINLTINEFHLIESIASSKDKLMSISEIAEDLGVTLPSVTIAINKLLKKGYVEKQKCEKDGRVVFVKLTRLGTKTNAAHQYFHQSMVRNIVKDLTMEEKDAMMKGISKLDSFFKQRLDDTEE